MTAVQTNTEHKYIFDQGVDTKFLGLSKSGASVYAGNLLSKFCIGSVPNGGYVASVMLHAVMQHYSKRYQKDPVAMNCFFTSKTRPAPCIVEIEDIKTSGKGYCLSRAVLKQSKNAADGFVESIENYNPDSYTLNVTCIFTFGNFAAESGVTHIYKPSLPPVREELQPMTWRFMRDVVEGEADLSVFPTKETDTGRPELRHIARFKDQRPVDFVSLPFWCDMIVPPAMILGPSVLGGQVWVPTMQMELIFKSVPKGKEVFCNFVSRYIINGRDEMDGEIFDADGNLLALTRHQCLVVPWSRNTRDAKL
ncbi:thioesterase-like superfamily-domain-containing protein [Umbelopsis sp. PMI_123]|nr:thioesterase-like superfamily-domain-containing protein [Umbelopsis sp. PMI_123]